MAWQTGLTSAQGNSRQLTWGMEVKAKGKGTASPYAFIPLCINLAALVL